MEFDELGPKPVTTDDIIRKYRFSRPTALKFMESPPLKSYNIGKKTYCNRDKFDDYLSLLIDTGGVGSKRAKKRTKDRPALKETLAPAKKATDIMEYLGVCRGSALNIMSHKIIHAYRPVGNTLYCETQYFIDFKELMECVGGEDKIGFITAEEFRKIYRQFPVWCFLEAVCTDEDFNHLIEDGYYMKGKYYVQRVFV